MKVSAASWFSLILIFYLSLAFFSAVSGKATGSLRFTSSSKCPCSNPNWCDPIRDTTRHEVFAFSVKNDTNHFKKYDWSKLTTVVMVGYVNDHLMCMAHALNVRVSYIASMNIDFVDPTLRKRWVQDQVDFIQEHHLDGINFDYESVIAENNSTMRDAYTKLVRETNEALKKVLPSSQVSVDVAWRQNTDQRFYDYKGLAANSDFLFVMSYDEQSQIFGECLALPNSGFIKTMEGLSSYITAGIPNTKLVLGLPWYGYIYPCTQVVGDKCHIKHVPFRGVSCSDAAGRQYGYSYIRKLSKMYTAKWNSTSNTPYFTFTSLDESSTFQAQYDNPESLSIKYNMAQKMKLKGVGMWNIDCVNYDDSPDGKASRKEMFGALPKF